MTFTPDDIAQTNLQLYGQLQRAGWPAPDITGVDRGYRLAAELLSGLYRSTGKPAIDHFVGVASVVAGTGGRPALVRAAILHNIYRIGLWADAYPRLTDRRRAEVTAAVGAEAEGIVAGYAGTVWSEARLADYRSQADRLPRTDRDLGVIVVADEIDNRNDLGVVLSGMHGRDVEALVAMADALDEPGLAGLLRTVAEAERSGEVLSGLVRSAGGDQLRPPRSHMPRPSALAGRARRWTRRRVADATRGVRSRFGVGGAG